MTLRLLAAATLLALSGAALAGPAGDKAQQRFNAIAHGNIDQLMTGYNPAATLQWVGGRLLPGDAGPAAQFMYQDARGARLTLYVRQAAADNGETAPLRPGRHGSWCSTGWTDRSATP